MNANVCASRRDVATFGLMILALACNQTSPRGQQTSNPVDDDLARLRGTWRVTSGEEDGLEIDPARLDHQRLVFNAERYKVLVGERVVEEGTYEIDETHAPRQIDLKILVGDEADATQLGLYRLGPEMLTLTFNRAGNPIRPRQFTTEPNTGQFTLRLKREP